MTESDGAPQDKRLPVDVTLGQRALRQGLLSLDQFQACYRRFQERRDGGETAALGDIFRSAGLLDDSQLKRLDRTGDDIVATSSGEADLPSSGAPDRLGPYRILDTLGVGSMGTVYRALHGGLQRQVALKVFHQTQGAGQARQALERFQREARILARLEHPGIVRVLDVGEDDGRHYMAMELIEGRDLRHRLGSARPPLHEVLPLMARIAEAVGHVHRAGFIHRDLKPANILIDADGAPRITDFGLGRALVENQQLTHSQQIMGTPYYMAPEHFDRQRRVRIAATADVFSLGVIFYELLMGRRPFEDESPVALFRRIVEDDPIPPRRLDRRIPQAVQAVCLKAMRKDPAQRYADAQALAEEMQRLLRYEAVQARSEPLIARWDRKLRRNPVATWLLVALSGVVAASASAMHQTARQHRTAEAQHRQMLRLERKARDREQVRRDAAERHLADVHHLVLGGRYRSSLQQAAAVIDQAIAVAPGYAKAHYLRGRALQRLGDWNAALAAYGRAIARDPRHAQALFQRGMIELWACGDDAAAARSLAAIDAQGDFAPLRRLGALYLELAQGAIDRAQALERAQALLPSLPLDADLHFLLGRLHAGIDHRLGDEVARFALRQTLQQWSRPDLDPRQAREHFDRALDIDPFHHLAAYSRAWLSLSERNFARAETDLQAALAISDRFAPTHVLWARFHFFHQRLPEAREAYRRAHELAAFELAEEEGLLRMAQGEHEEAERCLAALDVARLEAAGPIDLNPMYYLRLINLAALERYDEMGRLWSEVQARRPAGLETRMQALGALAVQILPMLERLAHALPTAHRPMEQSPADRALVQALHAALATAPCLRGVLQPAGERERGYVYLGRYIEGPARALLQPATMLQARLREASRRLKAYLPMEVILPFLVYRAYRAEQFDLLERAALYDAEDFYLRANLHFQEDRVVQALADLDQAVGRAPHSGRYHYARALCLGRQGRGADALAALQQAERLGHARWSWVAADPDLAAVRALPAFKRTLVQP